MSLPLLYEQDGAIATITLNRPSARNAPTPEMLCRLADAIDDFRQRPQLRVAILTGAGERAFCAGGDLASTLPLLTGARAPSDDWDRRLLGDPRVMEASSLRDLAIDKPLIAAVNGGCYAAGHELMLGTDIRVAADHAVFGFPEVQRALIPFAGSLVRLPRQIAYCHAMEMLLTGDTIDAAEALRRGLLNHVVPADRVLAKAREIARRIAGNGPLAVARIKQTVRETSGVELAAAFRLETQAWEAVKASEDAREGPLSFMEKRPPNYRGR